MIIHTYVMYIGGPLFSFYMKIKRLSQFSFSLSQFFLCTRAFRPRYI